MTYSNLASQRGAKQGVANNSTITALQSGKAYCFNLKVGLDKVELTSVSTYPGGWGIESDESKL